MKELLFVLGVSLTLVLSGCGESVDDDTTKPTFTSGAEADTLENQTDAITLTATDEGSAVTIAISGGDADDFDTALNTASDGLGTANASLVVTFKSAPDFETKDTYTFTATATDASGNEAIQEVTVNVTNDACTGGDVITHNGTNYCTVTSPYTGRVWLDRNLGATKVCADFNDTACFGDYYQWGRNFDGHQKAVCGTTTDQAVNVNNIGHGNYIDANNTMANDWARVADTNGSIRSANWTKTDGTSVCPAGFRVPTRVEWQAELFDPDSAQIDKNSAQKADNSDDRRVNAANCFLKLPSAGYRNRMTYNIVMKGNEGALWSGSVSDINTSTLFDYQVNLSISVPIYRETAVSVHCIKE
jgi:uncharacterized protein (TIGR02145 family)